MKLYKYTEKDLKKAIKSSYSYRQVLLKLNVAAFGGNYDVIRKAIIYFDLDISHFTGQASNKGKYFGPKRNLSEYLTNKFTIQTSQLRKRLIREKIFKPQCSSCNKKTWLNRPIPLELDHIDGNNKDNRLKNLRLLCPNCHAFTPTYRGKNKKK